jgi:UDP-N-acetyl-alpha-D-muramoyl-L-alanyl-L-glutamate epimerase
MTTNPQSTFIFSGHSWSPQEREATFSYTVSHNNEQFKFTEKLKFLEEQTLSNLPETLLKSILDNLSLVLGISYYKLFCPKQLVIKHTQLSKDQAEFWNTVYTKGLGEFFYQNKIDFRGLVSFPNSGSAGSAPIAFPRKNRALVGIGGGKDSIVAAELLKQMKKEITAFVVNTHPIKEQTIDILAIDRIIVKREVDSQLLELNKREDVYNGHVPFSALMAFISLFTSLLYDYRYIVFANEESASYGNVTYLGQEINHQWSKSFEFEKLIQEYIARYITPDVSYFSLLRPFSEIAIIKQFTSYPQYFSVFSSCNKNFRMVASAEKKWCGECAKCAFAFVMLAAFLPKEQVVGIFGENLFAKESLLQTFKELLGVVNIKPFDCVGTPDEVRVAFNLALQKGEYNDDVVMQFFKADVLPQSPEIEELQEKVFELSKRHRIPEEFIGLVNT